MHPFAHNTMIIVLLLAVCGLAGIVSAEDGLIGGDTGEFYITSSPSGAQVFFDDSYKGTTPVYVTVPSTRNGTSTTPATLRMGSMSMYRHP